MAAAEAAGIPAQRPLAPGSEAPRLVQTDSQRTPNRPGCLTQLRYRQHLGTAQIRRRADEVLGLDGRPSGAYLGRRAQAAIAISPPAAIQRMSCPLRSVSTTVAT